MGSAQLTVVFSYQLGIFSRAPVFAPKNQACMQTTEKPGFSVFTSKYKVSDSLCRFLQISKYCSIYLDESN